MPASDSSETFEYVPLFELASDWSVKESDKLTEFRTCERQQLFYNIILVVENNFLTERRQLTIDCIVELSY